MIPWLLKLRIDDRGKAADVRIPPFGVGESGPIWEADLSPDMNWIAYEGWPDGNNHDIFLMDSKGENRQRLTTDPGFDFNPVWIPR